MGRRRCLGSAGGADIGEKPGLGDGQCLAQVMADSASSGLNPEPMRWGSPAGTAGGLCERLGQRPHWGQGGGLQAGEDAGPGVPAAGFLLSVNKEWSRPGIPRRSAWQFHYLAFAPVGFTRKTTADNNVPRCSRKKSLQVIGDISPKSKTCPLPSVFGPRADATKPHKLGDVNK